MVEMIIIIVILLLFLSVSRIIYKEMNELYNHPTMYDTEQKEETIFIIPDSCPHCKNPNIRKLRVCEWCGSQIV